MASINETSDDIVGQIEHTGALLGRVRDAVGQVIFGQQEVIDEALITLLAGGHALIVGVPGLAKTRLVHTFSQVLGLDTKRIQFTPDLMPGDIIGSEILQETESGKRSFRFEAGPVFAQLLMADEINRASPRTQSALLQAMQEGYVTISGHDHALPRPFHVLATQNPIEQEGTYPLPEAQLDRFLMQIDITYPDAKAERAMLIATTGAPEAPVPQIMQAKDLTDAQNLVRTMPVGDAVVDAILEIVRRARPSRDADTRINDEVSWGPGPRASQALMLAVRARALLDGRLAPSVDDAIALARPVLQHRMALTFAARVDGVSVDSLIARLTQSVG